MPIPLPEALAIGSTIAGGIGSIFGSGTKTEIPPELREVYNLLLSRYREGISPEAESAFLRRTKASLGEEAGALGALTEGRLTRAGAGTGVQEAALGRINKQRLRGIGEATTRLTEMDEAAKIQALNQLRSLAPVFGSPEFKSQYGQGFADLLQGGLSYILNRPGAGGGTPGTQNIGITEPSSWIFLIHHIVEILTFSVAEDKTRWQSKK
jgi:hypothetical protein